MMEKDLRVLYGVWPAAGAFATFALSNGVIQLYWLQDGAARPSWLLGCWFALYNLVKLVFVGLAPRYGWTLAGQVVAAAGVGVGAAGVAGSFRCAWPLALTGAFCPIAAMPMRLNDEGLAPERFDAVVQHAWSCLVCGAICSALGAGAYELFGVGAVAGAAFVACCVCCASQAALLRRRAARPRAAEPSPLSPGRKEEEDVFRDLDGSRQLKLLWGLVAGLGYLESATFVGLGLAWTAELGLGGASLSLLLGATMVVQALQGLAWPAVGVSFSPKNAAAAIALSSAGYSVAACWPGSAPAVALAAAGGLLAVDFANRIVGRVLEVYTTNEDLFAYYCTGQRVGYMAGAIVASLVVPTLHCYDPPAVFLVQAVVAGLLAASVSYHFISNAVRIAEALEDQYLGLAPRRPPDLRPALDRGPSLMRLVRRVKGRGLLAARSGASNDGRALSSSFAAGLTSPRGSTPRRTYGALAPPAFALSPAPYVSPGAAGADDPYEPSSLGEDPRRRAAASRPRAARPRRAFKARERRSVGEDYAGTERDAPDRVRAPSSVVHEGTLLCRIQPLVWAVLTKLQNSLARSNRSRFG